jgi:S-adenosylmethionine:tRNA ribosyltransferase-isomerase
MTQVEEQLKLPDFDYDLPESLIAQEPSPVRDRSRLLVLKREAGGIEHGIFSDIEHYLVPGDLLVLNDTKVFPCRLLARKPAGGKAEIFLLSEIERNLWDALVKGGVGAGKRLNIAPGIEAEVINGSDEAPEPSVLRCKRYQGPPRDRKTPLPPYIKRSPFPRDRERYQTVYAAHEGAVAHHGGLHFTGNCSSVWSRGC